MILGLLPDLRGSLGELVRTGQHSRFVDGYLRPYARAFEETRYFSYADESLAGVTDDATVLSRVRVVPGGRGHPWVQTLAMALRHRRQLAACSVLRVFHVTGALPAVVARRVVGVPFVTTYGFWYARLARSRATRVARLAVERLGLAAASAVIVTTDELAAHVRRRVRDPRVVHLIPNGVDTAQFRPDPAAASRRASSRRRRVLYVGRLSPEKDLETLVTAAAKLSGRFDLHVTLVGDGPMRGTLVAAAARAGVSLDAPGVVDHRALPALYAGADAFVLPSLTEGHPKVLLEAMSAGTPCLASAIPASRSVLGDGSAGLLFPPGDADGLAAALEQVVADDDLARDLGQRGRARALESYDLAALVAREIDLLRIVARRDR